MVKHSWTSNVETLPAIDTAMPENTPHIPQSRPLRKSADHSDMAAPNIPSHRPRIDSSQALANNSDIITPAIPKSRPRRVTTESSIENENLTPKVPASRPRRPDTEVPVMPLSRPASQIQQGREATPVIEEEIKTEVNEGNETHTKSNGGHNTEIKDDLENDEGPRETIEANSCDIEEESTSFVADLNASQESNGEETPSVETSEESLKSANEIQETSGNDQPVSMDTEPKTNDDILQARGEAGIETSTTADEQVDAITESLSSDHLNPQEKTTIVQLEEKKETNDYESPEHKSELEKEKEVDSREASEALGTLGDDESPDEPKIAGAGSKEKLSAKGVLDSLDSIERQIQLTSESLSKSPSQTSDEFHLKTDESNAVADMIVDSTADATANPDLGPAVPLSRPRSAEKTSVVSSQTEKVDNKAELSDIVSKKAPPKVPKKPSSRIAQFQQMLEQQQKQDLGMLANKSKPPKPPMRRPSTKSTDVIQEGTDDSEENQQNIKASRVTSNFAQNLNGMIGMALPGMAMQGVPFGQNRSLMKPVRSSSSDTTEKTNDNSDVENLKEAANVKDIRRGRAKGPRGRKLPNEAKKVVEINNETLGNAFTIVVHELWNVKFSKVDENDESSITNAASLDTEVSTEPDGETEVVEEAQVITGPDDHQNEQPNLDGQIDTESQSVPPSSSIENIDTANTAVSDEDNAVSGETGFENSGEENEAYSAPNGCANNAEDDLPEPTDAAIEEQIKENQADAGSGNPTAISVIETPEEAVESHDEKGLIANEL